MTGIIIRKCCIFAASVAVTALGVSCNKYLDVTPDDDIATLDKAFNMRSKAINYLYSCYSYMPSHGGLDLDSGFMTGDELWTIPDRKESISRFSGTLFNIARGLQSANAPYANDWNAMYQGIRYCNTMIEKASTVPDLPEWESLQWVAEAKVLKAMYHFELVRKWGPVPIVKENLPIDASIDEVRVFRDPIDDCFDYILQILDEAIPDLPLTVLSQDELGRITRAAAAAFKAKVAVYAASPLFNNNSDQESLVDGRGIHLFATDKTDEEVLQRWVDAMNACKEAIDICHEANIKLYEYDGRVQLNDTLRQDLTLRNALTQKWNSEQIWVDTHTSSAYNSYLQLMCQPNLQMDEYPDFPYTYGNIGVPYKIAEQFYTNHGIPIANDKEWSGVDPMELRQGDNSHRWYIKKDYTTTQFCFDREPRFYAFLGFDGGIWFRMPQEINNPQPESLSTVQCRFGGPQKKRGYDWGPVTGFFPKKVVQYQFKITSSGAYSCVTYQFPVIRLADLYLLYAEAINEAEGPYGEHSEEMFYYIDQVRERAHIPRVKEAWDTYSNAQGKYRTQLGMREIIHCERGIELFAEGQRFWDLRRWKEASVEYEKGIKGYKPTGSRPEDYYQIVDLASQTFGIKDYFWPIRTSTIEENPNLVQNIGW